MHALETALLELAHTLPLELFVVLASFIEEVIPPIPSPSIVVLAGTLASVQSYTLPMLVTLVVLASLGKTIGAFMVYSLVKRIGIEAINRFGSFLHIAHADIESYGKQITGTARDYILLSTLRGIPIIPSVVLSVGSGILRLPIRVFVVGTFIGTLFRDTIYIVIGYTGASVMKEFTLQTSFIETILTLCTLVACLYGIAIFRQKKRKK